MLPHSNPLHGGELGGCFYGRKWGGYLTESAHRDYLQPEKQ